MENYFSMCSDKKAVEDWFKAANIEGSGPLLQRWNPLDTQGLAAAAAAVHRPKVCGVQAFAKHAQIA